VSAVFFCTGGYLKKYWNKRAASLTPYTAGEQPKQKFIKLNTNENAYPPSPNVAKAAAEAAASLRLYPDPDSMELRRAIAEKHGVGPENVFCSNGSDEALALAFAAFFNKGVPVRTYDITYSFYPVWAGFFDLTLEEIPLRIDFSADIRSMLGAANVVIANPNAPTGIAESVCDIGLIAENTGGVAIIDEAYCDFGGETAIPLVKKLDNLVVVRTFSKSHSLAGLRVGYAIAQEGLIEALRTVKDSFNSYPLDTMAQAAAAAAMRDGAYYGRVTGKIIKTREAVSSALREMGIEVLPSSANFIFVRFDDAEKVFYGLREHGVLVRYFPGERTGDYLRVTIGTDADMEMFLASVAKIVR